ncbi:MAG: Crp/Fnr family transcriptional regulator [Actinomycetota bacterium]|nr:Crp/Fnr family transcriptional regulator [Actinomycetota bacterium]
MDSANGLLRALKAAERAALEPDFQTVELDFKASLHEPGDPTPFVYFPNDGVVSLLTVLENGMAVELGHVGREGMIDISVFLGVEASESRIMIQVPGSAQRMDSKRFRKHVDALPGLRRVMGAYVLEFFTMVAQTTACNRQHTIQQRFARWVLMTQDRTAREEFPITQEFLAEMLGVTRSKVTSAAGAMKRRGLIDYRRGRMTVENRPRLETAACECYALILDRFEDFEGSLRMQA